MRRPYLREYDPPQRRFDAHARKAGAISGLVTGHPPTEPAIVNIIDLAGPVLVAALPVLSHLLGRFSQADYENLALQPRHSEHLWQIATFPLVHVSYGHLIFNVGPLLVLGLLVALNQVSTFWLLTAVVLLVSGWGAWLFSSADRVAGASALVFGYWGFILTAAVLQDEAFWTAAAALTLLLYAGLWNSLMRPGGGISWASHFWGLLGGVATALLVS